MLQKYYYWLPVHDRQVRRNFEIRGVKQLKNLFSYARRTEKMPDLLFPDNLEWFKKYLESPKF